MFTIGYTLHLILNDKVPAPLFFLCLYAPGAVYFLYHAICLHREGFFCEHPGQPARFPQKSLDEILFDSLRSIFTIGIYIMIFSIGANLLLSLPSFPPVDLLIGCLEITTGITHFGSLPLTLSQKLPLYVLSAPLEGSAAPHRQLPSPEKAGCPYPGTYVQKPSFPA